MTEGRRPGGLTALAVVNFVFGGFGALGVLLWAGMLVLITQVELPDDASREMKESFDKAGLSIGIFVFIIAMSAVASILLIASGVGYLLQRKFLGRTLGNIYGILGVVSSILVAQMMPETEGGGGGYGIGFIINLIYPCLTVLLLNTTFKEDFTN